MRPSFATIAWIAAAQHGRISHAQLCAYAVTGRTQAFHRAAGLAWEAFDAAGPAE